MEYMVLLPNNRISTILSQIEWWLVIFVFKVLCHTEPHTHTCVVWNLLSFDSKFFNICPQRSNEKYSSVSVDIALTDAKMCHSAFWRKDHRLYFERMVVTDATLENKISYAMGYFSSLIINISPNKIIFFDDLWWYLLMQFSGNMCFGMMCVLPDPDIQVPPTF